MTKKLSLTKSDLSPNKIRIWNEQNPQLKRIKSAAKMNKIRGQMFSQLKWIKSTAKRVKIRNQMFLQLKRIETAAKINKKNSERPVNALAEKGELYSLTDNLKSRDPSASKNSS